MVAMPFPKNRANSDGVMSRIDMPRWFRMAVSAVEAA